MDMAYDIPTNIDVLLQPPIAIMQNYGEDIYIREYQLNKIRVKLRYTLSTNNDFSTSISQIPVLEYLNQVGIDDVVVQSNVIDKTIQMSENKEVQDLLKLFNKEFETEFAIESITEFESVEEDKVSIAFNTNLQNVAPNEIGGINSRAFTIFKAQNYKTINAVMVL